MRSLLSVAAVSLGLASVAAPIEERDPSPPPPPKPKQKKVTPPIFRRSAPIAKGSIAEGNRRGGEHQHSREVARRLRQAARKAGA